MTKWEYRIEILELDDLDQNERELNRLGEEGWEAVAMDSRAANLALVLLKRPLPGTGAAARESV